MNNKEIKHQLMIDIAKHFAEHNRYCEKCCFDEDLLFRILDYCKININKFYKKVDDSEEEMKEEHRKWYKEFYGKELEYDP